MLRDVVTWTAFESIDMASQTPGYLHIRVNGVEVARGEWWDYEQAGYSVPVDKKDDWTKHFGLTVRAGQQVTIEIVPEYTTGAWKVVFTPQAGQ